MIRSNAQIPVDVLDAVTTQLRTNKTRSLMVANFRRRIEPVSEWIITVLSTEPEGPRYPIQWKSAKQRKAYFASNGFGKGIPYKRDHALARGWKTSLQLTTRKASSFAVFNDEDFAQFVQGEHAQPFHVDRWPQINDHLTELNERAEDAAINAWFESCETVAMTKGKR